MAFYTDSGPKPLAQRFGDFLIPGEMRQYRNAAGPNRTLEERLRSAGDIVASGARAAGPAGLLLNLVNRVVNGPNNPRRVIASEFRQLQENPDLLAELNAAGINTPDDYREYLRNAQLLPDVRYESVPSDGQFNYRGDEINSGPPRPNFSSPDTPASSDGRVAPNFSVGTPGITVDDITQSDGITFAPMGFSGSGGNTVSNISGGGARDNFTGHTGTTDFGTALAGLGMAGVGGGSLLNMQATRNQGRGDIGVSRLRQSLQEAERSNDPARREWAAGIRAQRQEQRQFGGGR